MPKLAETNLTHIPVLADEVLKLLAPKSGESYLDLTAGYGGHAKLVLARTGAGATLVDRDQEAVNALTSVFGDRARIIHQDFLAASRTLASTGQRFDMILADLGVSSAHLNDVVRGFSIKNDAPLDMRMDAGQKLTAATVVNSYSEDKLAEIIKNFGEEPKARTLARLIVKNRPLRNTSELAALAKQAWPGHSKTHPATRLFQAIRIEVNGELNQLEKALPVWLELLEPRGRLAIISFHSLEDRFVKNFFAEHSRGYEQQLEVLTKKPIVAGAKEIAFNPRARSAKLRAAVKIKIRGS